MSDISLREGLCAALQEQLDRVHTNCLALKDGDDPETVHQIRVGARRFAVGIRIFRKELSTLDPSALVHTMKALFAPLGVARELTVWLELLEPLAKEFASDSVLQDERRKAATALEAAISESRHIVKSNPCDAWLKTAGAFLGTHLQQATGTALTGSTYRQALGKKLGHMADGFCRDGQLPSEDQAAGLHAFRKKVRRLRYCSEFAATHGGPETKRLAKSFKSLATHLGTIHDIDVGLIDYVAPSHEKHLRRALAEMRHTEYRRATDQVAKLHKKRPYTRVRKELCP